MYYLLRLNLSASVPDEIRALYLDAIAAHNKSIQVNDYFDAGFNLICPQEIVIEGFSTAKIDLGVRGAMTYVVENERVLGSCSSIASAAGEEEEDFAAVPVGYFLYPRSSTGTKTSLRLANSVGVIDSGYRGNYIAVFDNIRAMNFKVDQGQRLVQLCAPNVMYPLRVELVEELDLDTVRGEGGFGSTGS
jgi:dUTP pyrophosphatase